MLYYSFYYIIFPVDGQKKLNTQQEEIVSGYLDQESRQRVVLNCQDHAVRDRKGTRRDVQDNIKYGGDRFYQNKVYVRDRRDKSKFSQLCNQFSIKDYER